MTIGKAVKVPESKCTSCGAFLDGVSGAYGDARPNPGDLTVCIHCQHVMAFTDDLVLRDLTDEEMSAIALDARVSQVRRALTLIKPRETKLCP